MDHRRPQSKLAIYKKLEESVQVYNNFVITYSLAFPDQIQVQKNRCNTATKIDKTKFLLTNGSLMKVKSIAEYILKYICPALSGT